jgi:hypothetical protein
MVDFGWNWASDYRTNWSRLLCMVVKWLPFENHTGVQIVKTRSQPKMLQPFENRSRIQMIYFLESGI